MLRFEAKSTLRLSASLVDDHHVRGEHQPSVPLGAAAEYDHSRQSQRLPTHRLARNARDRAGLHHARPVTRSSPRGRAAARAICDLPRAPTRRTGANANRRSQPQDMPAPPRRVAGCHRTRGPGSPSTGPIDRRSALTVTAVTMSGRPTVHTRRDRLRWIGDTSATSPRRRHAVKAPPANRPRSSPRKSTAEHQPKPSLGRTVVSRRTPCLTTSRPPRGFPSGDRDPKATRREVAQSSGHDNR